MNKPLTLYSIVFVIMVLGFWHPSLAWFNPLSIVILLFGTMWLWRVEGYSLYELGLHRAASWHRNVFLGISIGLVRSATDIGHLGDRMVDYCTERRNQTLERE